MAQVSARGAGSGDAAQPSLPVTDTFGDADGSSPWATAGREGRELRLALAMRGGVSLAVWIGGACAEIDALRRSRAGGADTPTPDDPPEAFWGPLLDAAGYGRVRVDVLAGASAGGLNGTLLAASLLYGIPFDDYRDIWLEVADLRSLLRETSEREPVSILAGDEYFLREMRTRLGGLLARTPYARRREEDYLDLHLTATLLDPVRVPVLDDPGETYAEVSYRAMFRFRHNPFTSDFRHAGDPAEVESGVISKLALAARSTSSFPGAFEPATILMRRPAHVGERAGPADEGMFGLFSDASRPRQFVIDGGVLDNIPVGRAIEAIAGAKAQGPTERWLCYLHPSPDTGPQTPTRDQPPNTIQTALGANAARASAESVLDDIAALRAHNDHVRRYRTMRQALLGPLVHVDTTAFLAAADGRRADYWALRARSDARRVRLLLEDPVAALGEDPFTCEHERWPLPAGNGWGVAARDDLEQALREVTAPPVPQPPDEPRDLDHLGVTALTRSVQVCLEAAIRLEHLGADGDEASRLKARLYDIAAAADLLAHVGELFWPVYAARHPPAPGDLPGWVAKARAARGRMLDHPDAVPVDAADLLEPFATLREELRARLAPLDLPNAAVAPAPGDRSVDEFGVVTAPDAEAAPGDETASAEATGLVPDLWSELCDGVAELARVAAATAAPTRDDETALFVRMLGYVATGSGGVAPGPATAAARAARTLEAVEVLSLPLRELSQRPPRHINFMRVAGSRRSPLEGFFPGGRLDAGDKLAGNELMNFAAFYKRSWRANDWMWGRLDAAATMVELVLRPAAVAAHFSTSSAPRDADPAARAEAFADMVRERVCAPMGDGSGVTDGGAWAAYFRGEWETAAPRVQAEAEALFRGEASDLSCAQHLLTSRRQWELLVSEIPSVVRSVAQDGLADGRLPAEMPGPLAGRVRGVLHESRLLRTLVADEAAAGAPVETPERLQHFLGDYRVGRESISDDIGRPRLTALAADLGLVTWRAVLHGLGKPGRWLRPVGVVLGLVRRFALATVRAPRPALLLLPIIAAVGLYVAVEDRSWPLGLNRVSGTVIALAAVVTLLYWGHPRLPRLFVTVAAIALAGAAAFAAEATLVLRWADWSTTFGTGGLWAALAVFLAVAVGAPWLGRLARGVMRRLGRRRPASPPTPPADPCRCGRSATTEPLAAESSPAR